MKRKFFSIVMILVLMLSLVPAAFAQEGVTPDRPLPAGVDGLKLETPVTAENVALGLDSSLVGA